MATFTVTTNRDVVDVDDGLTSLREAVALAEARVGADAIVFAAGVKAVQLTGGKLTIAGGELIIDGDRDNDGSGEVTVDAGGLSNHFEILAGAAVTLDGLTLANGRGVGSDGIAGVDGANGADGARDGMFTSPAVSGGTGGAGTAGEAAAGSIVNRGDLTLLRTVIADSVAIGGDGGEGGEGGDGGDGVSDSGFENGASGGAGGAGGEGGGAAGGVLNASGATLRLIDAGFVALEATDGGGGVGGAGGDGGGASSTFVGGNGGAGGNAGAPGRSGDAAGAILNFGTVLGSAAVNLTSASTQSVPEGVSPGGEGGPGRQGAFNTGVDGADGSASPQGASGRLSGEIVDNGSSTASVSAQGPLVYINATDLVRAEGDGGASTFTFHIGRTGLAQAGSVSWAVVPSGTTTGADFVGNALPQGVATFVQGQRSIAVTFEVAGDRAFENDEYFTVELSNPTDGAALGASSAEGAILADDVIAKVFSDTSRATLLDQLYTAQDLVEAGPRLGDGQAVYLASGAAVGDIVVGGNAVTISGPGASTGRFTLADGVTSITLAGGAAFAVTGNSLANVIDGNAGANLIDGKAGADTMSGGAGNDTFIVDDAGDRIIEGADGGTDLVAARVDYALTAGAEVETLRTNAVTGTAGLDLTGNEFGQRVQGNAGANVLDGGGGADTMSGYGGDDVYFVDEAGDQVVEAAGGGTDLVATRVDYVLAAGVAVETLRTTSMNGTVAIDLTGNEFAQRLNGNDGANVLNGAGGADTMIGYAGDDTYFVDAAGDRIVEAEGGGIDTVAARASYTLRAGVDIENMKTTNAAGTTAINLTGNEDFQFIVGNAGANVINGRGRADVLAGAGGADTFVFDSTLGGDNVDTITDFTHLVDTIRLDASVFSTLTPGALPASAFKEIGAGTVDTNDRILYDRVDGSLFYDADGSGSGAAVAFAVLSSKPASIDAGDFAVVA